MNHIRFLLDLSLRGSLTGNYVRYRINVYSPHALPAFITAVAAVEAFVNESFLTDHPWRLLRGTPLSSEDRDEISYKWELSKKLVSVPQLAFGNTFNKGRRPFQDMSTLIALRNDLTHYKMLPTMPKYMNRLIRQSIALSAPHPDPSYGYVWVEEISCSEGIRWAYNTAWQTMQALYDFGPSPLRENMLMMNLSNYTSPIAERDIREWYKSHGIQPDSYDPPHLGETASS